MAVLLWERSERTCVNHSTSRYLRDTLCQILEGLGDSHAFQTHGNPRIRHRCWPHLTEEEVEVKREVTA